MLLHSISHRGTGDINVINATSNGLVVDTTGSGKIGIRGRVNVKNITANGKTRVFISTSSSDIPCIYVNNDACVGMNGRANTLYVFTTRKSKFWGRHLLARDAYVKASGVSHVNVDATNKIFASASDYASIYFFGDPTILTAFEKNSGTVITMGSFERPVKQKRRHRNYKDEFASLS